jgi:hypothetical protein
LKFHLSSIHHWRHPDPNYRILPLTLAKAVKPPQTEQWAKRISLPLIREVMELSSGGGDGSLETHRRSA